MSYESSANFSYTFKRQSSLPFFLPSPYGEITLSNLKFISKATISVTEYHDENGFPELKLAFDSDSESSLANEVGALGSTLLVDILNNVKRDIEELVSKEGLNTPLPEDPLNSPSL